MQKFAKHWYKKILKVRLTVPIIVVLSIILFIVMHLVLPLDRVNAMAENFNKVAIGLAALLTLMLGNNLFEETTRSRNIEYYKKKYPQEEFGEKWILIAPKDDPGAIFLRDKESLLKHHIWNMKTMYDLGWQQLKIELLPREDFLSILMGESIRTRGDLGE